MKNVTGLSWRCCRRQGNLYSLYYPAKHGLLKADFFMEFTKMIIMAKTSQRCPLQRQKFTLELTDDNFRKSVKIVYLPRRKCVGAMLKNGRLPIQLGSGTCLELWMT